MATLEHDCSYIAGQNAKSEYIFDVSDGLVKDLASVALWQGWRRFGDRFFRPICDGCAKCESIRIIAEDFAPSRSMRRVLKKNINTKLSLATPSVSAEKIALYNKFHMHKREIKGWEQNHIDEDRYIDTFVSGAHDFAMEASYYIDNVLVGVDYLDVLRGGISSVYFIYDPDYAQYSLGVYSLLEQINWAKKLNLKYVYLGWAVRENASLTYKFDYKPHEILQNRPDLRGQAIWR